MAIPGYGRLASACRLIRCRKCRGFLADQYASSNLSVRLESILAGLELAIENPFGIGYTERTTLMAHRTIGGVESVHNGFLSLAAQSGIAVPILFILSGLYLLVQ